MSLMWMPAVTTVPPGFRALSAWGPSSPADAKMIAASSSSGGVSSLPPAQPAPRGCGGDDPSGRREDDRGPEQLGWGLVAAAGPAGAEGCRERLGFLVIRAREGEDLAALVRRDLGAQ